MRKLKSAFSFVVQHYVVLCMLLALIMLTLQGVGSVGIISILGIMMCLVGLLVIEQPFQIDKWIILPMILFSIMSACSSWKTYNNVVEGFASTQTIYIVLYIVLSCLGSDDRALLKRLCAGWVSAVAILGVVEFIQRSMTTTVTRLSGVLGNPNALGIFLVVGWFVVRDCKESNDKLLRFTEPFVLVALALTLSMGSFVALGVGMLCLALAQRGRLKERIFYFSEMVAQVSVAIGTGIFMYMAARYSGAKWLLILMAIYSVLLAIWWNDLLSFIKSKQKFALIGVGFGCVAAVVAIWMRPSSIATFVERLEMMNNAFRYLFNEPLFGVGPYQWRMLNLMDSDKYFNTYHIHNVILHLGVELGLVAMLCACIISVKFTHRKSKSFSWASCIAFLAHCMIDTGFFYLGITSLALYAGEDTTNCKAKFGVAKARVLLVLMILWWVWVLYSARTTTGG